MRQIVLDTETTGLSASDGHRIIEIGCVELINRRLTGRNLHRFVNPERDIDEGAIAVHGITLDQLRDKPRFADVAEEFIEFVSGAELLIHNAPFDIGFLDAEMLRLKRPGMAAVVGAVTDTLAMARELHPGRRNSLDALCDRYGISNAHRTLHGALLDAELLADVYLAMTRGQDSLEIAGQGGVDGGSGEMLGDWPPRGGVRLSDSPAALAAHAAMLADIAAETGQPSLWERESISG
ncbi:MAG: DNA polymerase III subunit epsilon [Burkholderiaceae bacterium]